MTTTGIIKVLPDLSPQPNRSAVIASVGFHGLLFAALALLSTASPVKDSQKMVNLVTLSPAEQSRLPQFATSTALPVSPTSPSSPVAPGTTAPLTPGTSNFDFGPLPPLSLPNVPLPPPPVYLPPPRAYLPPIRNYATAPPPPNYTSLPPLGIPSQPDVMAPPETPASGSPSPTPPLIDPNAIVKPGKNDQEALAQLPIWFTQARKTANADNIKLNFRAEAPPYPYPVAACKDKLEGKVSVAVLVSPEGKLVELPPKAAAEAVPTQAGGLRTNPQVILTSQQEILDQSAIAVVKGIKFEPAERYQALVYTLNYKYSESLCAAAPASTPESSPTAQPSPASSPAATTTPSPVEASPAPSPAASSPAQPEVPPSPNPSPTAESSPPPSPSPAPGPST